VKRDEAIWPRRRQRSAFLALPPKLLNKVIQEILKKEVMETVYLISPRLGYRERR